MKKTLLFFLFLYLQTNAQEIVQLKGKIVDEKTKETLVFANIVYPAKSLGFTTNPDGEFNFSLRASLKENIVISHLGYETATYTISDFLKLPNGIIQLKKSSLLLDEVVVVGKKENASDLMKKLYKTYKKNSPTEPHIAKAYYVEKAKYGDRYVFFRESMGYFIFEGYRFNVAAYSHYNFFCENTKMSDMAQIWVNKIKEMNIEKNKNAVSAGAIGNQFNRFEYYGPLSKKHKEYDYKIDSSYIQNGFHYYKIAFEGEKMKGYISFNTYNFHVTKVEYETIDLYSIEFDKRLEGKVSVLFNYYDNVPYVSKIKTEYTYQNFSHQNTLVIVSQKFKDFSLSNEEYWSFNTYGFAPFIEYIPEKWNTSHLDVDNDYELIQRDLFINNKSLEQQFIDNSGRWIDPKVERNGKAAFLKIQELKNNF